jgi:hypothetical protein
MPWYWYGLFFGFLIPWVRFWWTWHEGGAMPGWRYWSVTCAVSFPLMLSAIWFLHVLAQA